jgi:DNA-binding NarL/FixJ family response regulator
MPRSTDRERRHAARSSVGVVDDDAIVRAWVRHSLEGSEIPVLVITAAPEAGLNEAVLEAGAQGVVLKRGDPKVLLTALRSVAGGQIFMDPEHPKRLPDHALLSPREREVLRHAAAGATDGSSASP